MQFERVSKRLDSSIVLAPGDFISEKKQWVRLLERVEAIFSNVRNEKALFYYLVQDFGDPKESTEGGYFCWDFTVDNEFYFNIDFQKTGFELLFDATNGNYRLKRLFLAWFWKNLISGLQQIISKPRDKVVTNKVAKLLNKTKLFPRVLVLKESEFPCCVFCANELDRNLVETVIPDLQPGRKLDLLDSKLNEKKCSKCGFTYLVFPNLFKYMDKRGLTIILYENKETSDAIQKIFRKKQKNLFQEMKKSVSKPEFAGFSLTTHKTDLFVEAIRQFEEWDKVLSEERIEPILNQDYRHNYKKFYFAYVFGGLPIALKFLTLTTFS